MAGVKGLWAGTTSRDYCLRLLTRAADGGYEQGLLTGVIGGY